MIEQEEWKDIPEWEGLYSVSNLGRVKSHERMINESRKEGWKPKSYVIKEIILKQSRDSIGRVRVSLSKNSKVKYRFIHSLVLLAFVGKRPNGFECCHIDGNPSNNNLTNLYYGTRSDNIADAKRHGTFPMGSRRPGALLNPDKVLKIYELCVQGVSDSEIAKQFNVTRGCIVQIRIGKNWREVTGGKRITRKRTFKL